MGLSHPTAKSFSYALEGIKTALKREPNFRIHILASILVLVGAYFLSFSAVEWLILLITIIFVLVMELINTSVEALTNLVSPEIAEEAKVAKDVAAAAVFFSAFLAVSVGLFLFVPKLLNFF